MKTYEKPFLITRLYVYDVQWEDPQLIIFFPDPQL